MLRKLAVKNFALIREIELDFDAGMTILLGETGAGKSILLGALSAVLGTRVGQNPVFPGQRRCIIEATFFDISEDVCDLLATNSLAWENDALIIRREISDSGISRSFVNDTPVNTSLIRTLSPLLLDFHGQHDTSGLMQNARQLNILDSLLSDQSLIRQFSDNYARYAETVQVVAKIRDRIANADLRKSALDAIINEIAAISPADGEDIALEADLARAESSEVIVSSGNTALNALYLDSNSANNQIAEAISHLKRLTPVIPSLQPAISELESAAVSIAEIARELTSVVSGDDFAPEKIEQMRIRLAQLQRLRRRYGSIDDARKNWQDAVAELDSLDHAEFDLEQAMKTLQESESSVITSATSLSLARHDAAIRIADSVQQSLHNLGMAGGRFTVEISGNALTHNGFDNVRFLFSANSGFAPKPLAQAASGGELSRLMLAIKLCIADFHSPGTMVFDEIDSGISGRIAASVGAAMASVAENQQILCITHLPQIAASGDCFVHVFKDETDGQPTVNAIQVDRASATDLIASMLAGSLVTSTSVRAARELMKSQKAG